MPSCTSHTTYHTSHTTNHTSHTTNHTKHDTSHCTYGGVQPEVHHPRPQLRDVGDDQSEVEEAAEELDALKTEEWDEGGRSTGVEGRDRVVVVDEEKEEKAAVVLVVVMNVT
jgi:hypothetical protein